MPNDIAVIGERDFISGFGALGCVLYPVDDKADLPAIFVQVIETNFLCIFILERYASKMKDLLEEYSQKIRPLIIPLSDFRQDLSLSDNLLSRLTIKAVGQDITGGV